MERMERDDGIVGVQDAGSGIAGNLKPTVSMPGNWLIWTGLITPTLSSKANSKQKTRL